jgi:hypothetical protein
MKEILFAFASINNYDNAVEMIRHRDVFIEINKWEFVHEFQPPLFHHSTGVI